MGIKKKRKMKQCKKSDNVMDAGNHFKNGASPKSQMSRGNNARPAKP